MNTVPTATKKNRIGCKWPDMRTRTSQHIVIKEDIDPKILFIYKRQRVSRDHTFEKSQSFTFYIFLSKSRHATLYHNFGRLGNKNSCSDRECSG